MTIEEDVIKLRLKGMTYNEIAKELNVNNYIIYTVLKDNYMVSTRGNKKISRREKNKARAEELVNSGLSIEDAAKEMNLTVTTIINYFSGKN